MVSGHAPGPAVVGATLVFTILAILAVALRLYVRLRLVHNAGYEDAIITIAAIATIGLAAATCLEVHYGVGRHESKGLWETIAFLKTLYASILLYNIALSATKLSILLQYLRIFPQKGFRIAVYVVMAVVFLYFNWTFWSGMFACVPIRGFWDVTMDPSKKKCLPSQAQWFASAGINIVTDVAVTVLPLPMFQKLNMAKRAKIGLMLVFGLGGFVCIISLLRLEALYAVTTHMDDQMYNNSLPALWSVVEVTTGVLCSCLPTLKVLVVQVFPKIFNTHKTHEYSSDAPHVNRRRYITHEELGQGLSGREAAGHGAHVSRGRRDDGSWGMDEFEGHPKQIKVTKVVTVVDQEMERRRDNSDQESTRDLIHKQSFSE